MNIAVKIAVSAALLAVIPIGAGASTFLIDTREEHSRAEMESAERISLVSMETGIMDVFFDAGHIFFNIYTPHTKADDDSLDRRTLAQAADEGASYLLVLVPGADDLTWRLYTTGRMSPIAAGGLRIEEFDPELGEDERWMRLGSTLAESVLASIH